MAVPTVVGVSASAASGTANITPAFPSGYTVVANDVAVTFIECNSTDTINAPAGWATMASQTQATGTTTKLTAIWRRLQVGDTAPTIVDPGANDHMVGRMIIVRGCATQGNPWDVAIGGTDGTTTTAFTVTGSGVTTVYVDTLMLIAVATGQDIASTAAVSGWTNASLTLTERMDNWVADGNGGGFAMATAPKATPGTLANNTTGTLAIAGNTKAWLQIALRPPLSDPAYPNQRSPRPAEGPAVAGPYMQQQTVSYFQGG